MPQRHSYPSDDELVAMMAASQSFSAVARQVGVRRESLRDYVSIRPELDARMREHLRPMLTPEQRAENDRQSHRETARRWRAVNPDEARRRRREQMRAYGPEYRRRWNERNRLRRRGLERQDEGADEYASILQGDPCVYCCGPCEEIDHILPIARGGSGAWTNLAPTCVSCNRQKNARSVLGFMLARTT